jgi:hypothetical protein
VAARGENARRAVSILVLGAFVSTLVPRVAFADVSLPPPPPKKSTPDLPPPPPKSNGGGSASGGTDLPPPPKKKGGSAGSTKKEGSEPPPVRYEGGTRSSPSDGRGDKTLGWVLLVSGGVVTLTGTTMLLLGAGLKPTGKQGGKNTELLVAGGVTTGIGLTVAAIGLVILVKANDGKLPSFKAEGGAPTLRAPEWASLSTPMAPASGEGFVLPLGGRF